MCPPMMPEPPVKALTDTCPKLAALPTTVTSSPGAASHRVSPPKALKDRFIKCNEELRCGLLVAALLNTVGGAARAAVAAFMGASVRAASLVSDPVAI